MSNPEVQKSDEQWRTELSAMEFHVLREAGTERPFSSPLEFETSEGVYRCRACNTELFRSTEKFDAQCGWPSFYQPLAEDRVRYIEDSTLGMLRTEVRCSRCDSHLGHVFKGEGFDTPTDLRYCINGVSLNFESPSSEG